MVRETGGCTGEKLSQGGLSDTGRATAYGDRKLQGHTDRQTDRVGVHVMRLVEECV